MSDRDALMRHPPPFTPSGMASFDPPHPGRAEQRTYWQWGLLCHWRTDPARASALLPEPLEPTPETATPYLWLAETQAARGEGELADRHPALTNWHEATFLIPCRANGVDCVFHWVAYKDADLDHQVIIGAYEGLTTKLASFSKTFPLYSQLLNREMRPGGLAQVTAARFDERIITSSFIAVGELDGPGIRSRIPIESLTRVVGVRHMPDFHTAGDAAPLVHDLVLWQREGVELSRAWSGDAQVLLTTSDDEELDLLRPQDMLESYFVHLRYRSGRATRVHDYLSREPGITSPIRGMDQT